jgi:hypothetical protein
MISSPGCWQLFGELTARDLGQADRRLAADCYATQHPGGAEHEPRQRKSVAVHLTSLCLYLEQRLPAARLMAMLNGMSRTVLPLLGAGTWPFLPPPRQLGAVTVASLGSSPAPRETIGLDDWADSVWRAWSDQHETVRGWARLALQGR